MTEDNTTDPASTANSGGHDDDRFEVKWRKKSEPSTSPGPSTSAGESETDVATLQRELDLERQRVRELQDRWQRAAADLANYRRRTEEERDEVEKFSTMLLVQELLPVLDNFDRALSTVPGNLRMLTWIQGVALIERHLRAIFEHQGLAPIEAVGKPFNTQYHEAIHESESVDAQPGTVLQEYQKGYTMHGRVIRPALVEIAASPAAGPPSAPEVTAPERTDEAQGEEIAQEAETENTGP